MKRTTTQWKLDFESPSKRGIEPTTFTVGSFDSDNPEVKYLQTAVNLCNGDTLTVTHTITIGDEDFTCSSILKYGDAPVDESFED